MEGGISLAVAVVLIAIVCVIPPVSAQARITRSSTTNNPREPPAKRSVLDVAADIELFAACLEAGLSLTIATTIVAQSAPTSTSEVWKKVASLEALGFSSADAWQEIRVYEEFSQLCAIVQSARESGASLAPRCFDLANSLRSEATDQARAKAERAGVMVALPLVACFLPAFIVLGLAPVVISLATDLLNT